LGRTISFVSFGPKIKRVHEPGEKVEMRSIDINYRMLREILSSALALRF